MNTSESLETLYRIILELKGPKEAKKFTSDVLYGVICEIQDEGQEVSAIALDRKLAKIASDFKQVAHKTSGVA